MRQEVILPEGTNVNHPLVKDGCCRRRLFSEPCTMYDEIKGKIIANQ